MLLTNATEHFVNWFHGTLIMNRCGNYLMVTAKMVFNYITILTNGVRRTVKTADNFSVYFFYIYLLKIFQTTKLKPITR